MCIISLPGKEVLYEPGKTDGQTKLVREGTLVICYSWSASEGTWNKVGDVMGAAGGTQANSGKTLYEGKVKKNLLYKIFFKNNCFIFS